MQREQSRPDHEQRSAALLLLATATLLCLIQLVVLVPNHDIAWLLELSQRMLSGGKYYTDFYELNPPLYPILLLPVDLLSRLTAAAPYTILIIGVSGLLYYVSLRLFASLAVITPGVGFRGRIALAVCLQAQLFFLPGYDFGQRDPVALCLILPLLCWLSVEPAALRASGAIVLASVLAAIGVLIKPYLAGAVILLVVVRVLATRRVVELLVPVVLPALLVTAAYVVLIFQVFPEWLVMAHVASDSYQMYDTYEYVPKWFSSALVLIALLAAANEYLQTSPTARRAIRYFVAVAAGALLSYLVQHKGFSYHLVPAKIMLGLLLVITAVALVQRLKPVPPGPGRVYLEGALVVNLAMSLVAFGEDIRSLTMPRGQARFYARLAASLTDLHAGNRLFFFSTSLGPEFPLNLYYHFTPSSRFPCLWTLPAVLAPRAHQATNDSAELRNLVAQDFGRWQPTAFIVNESPHKQAIAGNFEFLPWFRQDPALRDILERYQFAARVPGYQPGGAGGGESFAIYILRQRRTASAQAAPGNRN